MRRLTRQLTYLTTLFFKPTMGRSKRRHLQRGQPEGQAARAARCRPTVALVDGRATALVRPYLVAYEGEQKGWIQRLRRDNFWCAACGIDLDGRGIHAGLEAAS